MNFLGKVTDGPVHRQGVLVVRTMAGIDAHPPALRVQRPDPVGGLRPDPGIALPPRQQQRLVVEPGQQIIDVNGRSTAILGDYPIKYFGGIGIEAGHPDALHQLLVDVGVRNGIDLLEHLLDPCRLLGVQERRLDDGPLDPFLDRFEDGIRLVIGGFRRDVGIAEASGAVQQHAALDEILPSVGAGVRGGVERGESTQTVSRHDGRLADDLFDEIQRLVSPYFRRVIFERLVRQSKSQQIERKDMIISGQFGDVVPKVIRRGSESMNEQQRRLGRVAEFQIVDGMASSVAVAAVPLPRAVSLLVPREALAGVNVEGIEGGGWSC